MKTPGSDLLFTAVTPIVWGSTYIVTSQFLPEFSPMTVAMLRALPAGLLLLLIVRQLPEGIWWARAFLLGALNISLFLSLLFVAAYRLPGGVAATVLSVQPLIVIFVARLLLGSPIRALAVLAAGAGVAGVALLVLSPGAALDPLEMRRERAQHFDSQRVHLGRVVEPEFGDAAPLFEPDAAHWPHPIGASASSDSGRVTASSATRTRPPEAATISRAGSMPGMISVATRP